MLQMLAIKCHIVSNLWKKYFFIVQAISLEKSKSRGAASRVFLNFQIRRTLLAQSSSSRSEFLRFPLSRISNKCQGIGATKEHAVPT